MPRPTAALPVQRKGGIGPEHLQQAMGRTQLLDHLAGGKEEGLWERGTGVFGCLEIDDGLEAGWLFDRKVGRFGARQDFMYQLSGVTVQVGLNSGIGHQSALVSELPKRADGRDAVCERQLGNALGR